MSSVPTSTPTMPGSTRFGRHIVLGAAFGGILIAAAVTAFWVRDGGSSARVDSAPAAPGNEAVHPRPVESTTIFVSSAAEFAEMSSTIVEINAIRSATGEPPLTVVLVGSEGFGSTVTGRGANIAEGYDFAGPPVRVPEALPASTVYLVGSEAEASYLRTAIADSDSIRAAVGEPPLHDSVVVVSSDAEADMLRTGIADANSIRVATGETPLDQVVVDLRGG